MMNFKVLFMSSTSGESHHVAPIMLPTNVALNHSLSGFDHSAVLFNNGENLDLLLDVSRIALYVKVLHCLQTTAFVYQHPTRAVYQNLITSHQSNT